MSWNTIRSHPRRARKAHSCIWCAEQIPVGETYHEDVGKFYGELQQNRYHPECYKAATTYWCEGEEDFSPGEFKRGTLEER